TSAGALNGALIAAGRTPSEMLDFWLGLAERPPVVANRGFFSSVERALGKLALAEPLRGLKERLRSFRMAAHLARKHAVFAQSGRLAALAEYVMTARFDAVSRLLDEVHTSYLFSTEPLRARLAEAIGGWALKESDVKLAINAVDVRSGQVVRYVSHPPKKHSDSDDSHYEHGPITVDVILASASIPLLFNPVTLGGRELWDGGLLVNTPLAPVVALGATRVLPVLVTSGRDAHPHAPLGFGDAIERLADAFLENAYNSDRKLLLERNKLARLMPDLGFSVVELYDAIRPLPGYEFEAGSYLYFDKTVLRGMYEAGRDAARAWLAAGPRVDERPGHPSTVEELPTAERSAKIA
ncbi:MAG: patatin-like phospholipase family protein, partial [Myxococcales bacterium]|nr:patatin-like phospholipase family protein [Myxococcales bacterium]